MANMSSITEPPASTVGINMTTETSNIATAVGAKRRKPNKVTQIQVMVYNPLSFLRGIYNVTVLFD